VPLNIPPAKELVPPGWSQGNPRQTALFVTEKQPNSIAIGLNEPVSGPELHPLKSSAFRGALLRQQSRANRDPPRDINPNCQDHQSDDSVLGILEIVDR
jgi:hypothetical protein